MTIIGFEKRRDGSKNLIVFDPMFHDAVGVSRFVGQEVIGCKNPGELLKAYRREGKYLKRYSEFEMLKLVSLYSYLPSIPEMERDKLKMLTRSRLTPPEAQKGTVKTGSWD